MTMRPNAIKDASGKHGKGAEKVIVLNWGDLTISRCTSGNLVRKGKLSRQESAEAIVPVSRGSTGKG